MMEMDEWEVDEFSKVIDFFLEDFLYFFLWEIQNER